MLLSVSVTAILAVALVVIFVVVVLVIVVVSYCYSHRHYLCHKPAPSLILIASSILFIKHVSWHDHILIVNFHNEDFFNLELCIELDSEP